MQMRHRAGGPALGVAQRARGVPLQRENSNPALFVISKAGQSSDSNTLVCASPENHCSANDDWTCCATFRLRGSVRQAT
ncbi:MAG: hypothetical protein ACOVQL_07165 [Limnohabitans sp.]